MSVDIHWDLLSPDGPSRTTPHRSLSTSSSSSLPSLPLLPTDPLAVSLIQLLNDQLASASRPSFIGPVTVTGLDFGSSGPEVEIRDIRDVWRGFEEGEDDSGDDAISPPSAPSAFGEEYDFIDLGDFESDGFVSRSVAAVGLNSARSFLPQLSPARPPSPPARVPGHPPSSSIPSLQVHFRVSHHSNLIMTLLTSLQVNYPSPMFMALPLKLSITGLTMNAELIVAYSGNRNRIHLCIADEPDTGKEGDPGPKADRPPIGQRILSNLSIESEIGHADAHVLRNVGKVERFIADVIRKAITDELVYPNFYTIAL